MRDANSKYSSGRRPTYQRQAPLQPTLPAGGARKMFGISLVAGIVVAI